MIFPLCMQENLKYNNLHAIFLFMRSMDFSCDFLFLLDLFISFKINMYHHIFVRYVAAELATDIVINVGNVKFHLHKVRFNLTLW